MIDQPSEGMLDSAQKRSQASELLARAQQREAEALEYDGQYSSPDNSFSVDARNEARRLREQAMRLDPQAK